MPGTARHERPFTLTVAAILLGLAAILAFATPYLPQGNGFGFGTSQPKCSPAKSGDGSTAPEEFSQSGQGGGWVGSGPNQDTGWAMAACWLPAARGWKALVVGLFALAAAVGVWRRSAWGTALALVVSVVWLLAAAVTLLAPALSRVDHSLTLGLAFVVVPRWQAFVSCLIAFTLTVLLLLPPAVAAPGTTR